MIDVITNVNQKESAFPGDFQKCLDDIYAGSLSPGEKYYEAVKLFEKAHPIDKMGELKVIKLLLYDYFIQSIESKYEAKGEHFIDEITLFTLRKMFYFTCLLSVNESSEISLFKIFDRFVAWQNGPVEQDCYYLLHNCCWHYTDTLETVNRFGWDNGCIFAYEDQQNLRIIKRENAHCNVMGYLSMFSYSLDRDFVLKEVERYKKLIDLSLDKLLNALFLPGLRNTESLIELSRNKIWEAAYYLDDEDNPDCIMSYDIALLREESKRFCMSVAA